jgi:hypothetical protein
MTQRRAEAGRWACRLLIAFGLLELAACGAPATPLIITDAPPTPTSLPTLTPAPTPLPGGLHVDAGQELGPISPLVYGTNYGPQLFVPLQMQPYAEEAHLTLLRYPGGNWGDNNDIQLWNVDQLAAFARQIGAEVSIHVRLKGGTAQQAADLVRYVNVEKGYNVRFWAIGNEPNLFADYSVERFNSEWREWAAAMRAVDPSILLVGPEINQFYAQPTQADQQKLTDWVSEFLRANGDMLNIVSFHRYPFPKSARSGPPTLDELRANSAEWDELMPAMRALIREQAGRDLPIAVTEVNSSWVPTNSGETTLDSHFNAIWWGDVLGRLIRQGAFMVNQFAIVGDFGLMDNYEVKPIYYVYVLYQRFGVERVYASSDDPGVSIFAAKRPDGALTLMIVNLESTAVDKTLKIDNAALTAPAETWLFDKAHKAEPVDPTPLGAAATLHLPAESMSLLVVKAAP